jgi:hypothetical protein
MRTKIPVTKIAASVAAAPRRGNGIEEEKPRSTIRPVNIERKKHPPKKELGTPGA